MKKDAYKRKTSDNKWKPPKSPHKLIQERYVSDPWKVLVACILLNKSNGEQVKKILPSLFNLCPDAKSCTEVAVEDIELVIKKLGRQRTQSVKLKRFSEEYLEERWTHVTDLYGVGDYAGDAYAIFCTGKWDQVTPSDNYLNRYWDWIRSREQ